MKLSNKVAVFAFIFAAGACPTQAAISTIEDLRASITSLEAAIEEESAQNAKVIEVIDALVAKPLSLTVGYSQGKAAEMVDIPIIFRAGDIPVSALQFDIKCPVDALFFGADSGPAALAAQKSAQSSILAGGGRVIIFGLNQTPIGTGIVAIVRLNLSSLITNGVKSVSISGISGSTADGTSVPISGTKGSLVVR